MRGSDSSPSCELSTPQDFSLRPVFYLPLLLALLCCPPLLAAEAEPTTVGLPAHIEAIFLRGSELESVPVDRNSAVIVRVLRADAEVNGYRYDLEYTGFVPGKYDLRDHLRRKDKSSTKDLPSIPVVIKSILPANVLKPSDLQPSALPWLGGYRLLVVLLTILWMIVLLVILFAKRGQRLHPVSLGTPVTLADRLRPLVEQATAGKIDTAQLAELEQTLIVYWTRRLHLGDEKPAGLVAKLRAHPEAGPLLEQLESWLHRPAGGESVDVARLLDPYRNLPADTLEREAVSA